MRISIRRTKSERIKNRRIKSRRTMKAMKRSVIFADVLKARQGR
jgi:hypothetical protein